MASSVGIAYKLVVILLDKKRYTATELINKLRAQGLKPHKDTIANHLHEMRSNGLVRITEGRCGGVEWIA